MNLDMLKYNPNQCSHSKFKLGVFIPPHFEIRGYEVKFEGMTFWDDIKLIIRTFMKSLLCSFEHGV